MASLGYIDSVSEKKPYTKRGGNELCKIYLGIDYRVPLNLRPSFLTSEVSHSDQLRGLLSTDP